MTNYDIFAILSIAAFGSFHFMELFLIASGLDLFFWIMGSLLVLLISYDYINIRKEEFDALGE